MSFAWGGLVLLGGLLLSIGLTRWVATRNTTIEEQETAAQTQRLLDELPLRIQGYEKGVRGTRGAVLVGGQERISLETFLIYAHSRDIDVEFPGAKGFGFIRRVAAEREAAFVDEARRTIRPDFSIRQSTPHAGERDVVAVVEPSSRNLGTWGLDIASDERTRGAAIAALHSGRATLTAPIAAAAPGKDYDLLLLLPVYKPYLSTSSEQERVAAGLGWAYAALSADQVLSRLNVDYRDFTLKISDVTGPGKPTPFFSSGAFDTRLRLGLTAHRALPIYGRIWNIAVQPTPRFLAGLHLISPGSAFLLGVVVSLLLASLCAALLMLRQHRRAELRNQELLAGIVENSTDVIIVESLDNIVISWNGEAERTFGYKAEEAVGRRLTDLILPEEMIAEDTDLLSRSAHGMRVAPFDTVRRRRDGTSIDVSIAAVSIIGADGRVSAVAKTLRDISHRKKAERALTHTNNQLEEMLSASSGRLESMQRNVSTIMDALPSMVSYWDTDLILRYANRAYLVWFDAGHADLVGLPMRQVFGDDGFEHNRQHALSALAGRAVSFERTLPGRDGTAKHFQVHYIPDMVEGRVQGFHALAHDITSAKMTEQRLRASEAFLDRAGIVAGVGGWELDMRTQGLTWSEQTYRIHEIESGVPLDVEQALRFYPPEARAVIEGALAVCIATGKSWDVEVPFISAKGRRLWVRSVGTVEFSEGRAVKLVGALQDVSERKQIEAQLRETNERFKIAADAAGIGIWEYDPVAGTLTWDDWIYRIYGVERASGIEPQWLWKERLHSDDLARCQTEIAAALAGHGEFDTECRIVRPDGEIRYLQVASRTLRASDGSPLRMTGVNIDITDRRRVEQKMHEVTALLRTVLDSALEISIIATDPDLTITVFNRGAERLLGYTSDQMVGNETLMLFHDADEIRACAEQMSLRLGDAVAAGTVFTHASRQHTPHEWTYVRKDGARIAVSLITTPMITNDGEVLGYLGIAHDVTRQKQYEESLRLATRVAERANGAKSEFLANMSHEIRTPLNAIIGLGYLLDQTVLSEDQRQFLSKIQFAGRALLGVINNVLDLSKIEAGEMSLEDELFDLPELVQDLSQMLTPQATTKGIQLIVEPTLALPRKVRGDASRLRQILTNLLSNAIKFTEVGHVRLNVFCVDQTSDRARLRCEVEDTGIGIGPAALQRLFTPFTQADASTTRRFGGTGLGLSIAKRFVELMGGEVGVTSQVGVGTNFWAEVPLRLAVDSEVGTAAGLCVLIADSGGDSHDGLGAMVRALGLNPLLVETGAEVLETLSDEQAQSWPDVLIMQKQLRDIEARQLIARMKKECTSSTLPAVIVISDHSQLAPELPDEREEFAHLADSMLARPVTSSSLFNAINAVAAALPDGAERLVPTNGSDDTDTPGLNGVHILVVDDSDINREVAQRILEKQSATVATCGDGQAAVDYVRKHGDTLDIVLMDVQMPLLDGNEATRLIRGELQRLRLPIIALTAGALVAERQRSIEAGMNDFVSKPFDPEALIRKVRHLVERARGKPIEALHPAKRSIEQPSDEPTLSSIDAAVVRQMFGGDVTLFHSLLSRVLDDCADLALPVSVAFEDSAVRAQFIARMHKLKGSAGMIGAHRIMRFAGALETALMDTRPAEVVDGILLQLASALTILREETAPLLKAGRARPVAATPAAAIDNAMLEELCGLLEGQNLAAIDKFEEMSAWLRTVMTADAFDELNGAVANLDFAVGAKLLRGADDAHAIEPASKAG